MFVSLERSFQPLLIRLTGSYTYSRSTNEKQLFEYDASFHTQLIYTPLHRASLISGLEYRYFGLSIRGNYTGMTYTTRDNLASLPGYFIPDAALSRSFRFRQNNSLVALLNLNNILN